MLVLHVLYWLLVSFWESYVIDTSKHLDKQMETRDQTGSKPGMETAKKAGHPFRLFNPAEFGINRGISVSGNIVILAFS
jgi:hypothetical protein